MTITLPDPTAPAQRAAGGRAVLVATPLSGKAGNFNPNQPRDRTGKWVETGAQVRNVLTGAVGTVTQAIKGGALTEDQFEVELPGGAKAKWERSAVDVVANPDGSKPTVSKPGTPEAQAEQAAAPPPAPFLGMLPDTIEQVYGATDENNPANDSTGLQGAVEGVYAAVDVGTTQETADVLTEAQKIAVKQKWKLPTGTVADLQAKQDEVTIAATPSVADLVDGGMSAADATKEAKRLARNAQVNAWRARTKLQAAIDTVIAADKAQGKGVLAPSEQTGKSIPAEAIDTPAAETASLNALLDSLSKFDQAGDDGLPKALYSVPVGEPSGPGGVYPGQPWHVVLTMNAGPDSPPIPVVDIDVDGYKISSGWAMTIGGIAYVAESKPDETPEQTGKRMQFAAALTNAVMATVPQGWHHVQSGIALVNGPNPHDADWAKAYDLEGFKSDAASRNGNTTYFNGAAPEMPTIAHEFGHNFDSSWTGGLSSTTWLSDLDMVTQPGQTMTWKQAIDADSGVSSFYQDGRFVETRPGKPMKLGQTGVTDYANAGPREDFAESVRLWMKDRRYNKVGYDPTTGDNLRFSDIYPERARLLDLHFGVDANYDTPARAKRMAEFEADVKAQALTQEQTGQLASWNDPLTDPVIAVRELGARHGLSPTDAMPAWGVAVAAAKKEADAKALAAAKAAEAVAAKLAKEQVQSFEAAFEKGLINKSERDKLTGRRRARIFHMKKKGVPEEEARALTLAWERQYLAEHFGASSDQGAADEPWVGATMLPGHKGTGAQSGTAWLEQSGTTKHPLAKSQVGPPQQAKANIAAELASRMNNPSDWQLFREYKLSESGGEVDYGSYEDTNEGIRHTILGNFVGGRVNNWASTSGDSDENAVLMQRAAQDEFGQAAHPAPRMDKAQYDSLMANRYTAQVEALFRRMLRVQYEHTQEELAAAGITHVKLFRGMNFNKADAPEWALPDGQAKQPQLQPLNSWSTKRSTANLFSGGTAAVIFEATIPVELIVGSARTGFGCRNEFEFVVMDAPGTAIATPR